MAMLDLFMAQGRGIAINSRTEGTSKPIENERQTRMVTHSSTPPTPLESRGTAASKAWRILAALLALGMANTALGLTLTTKSSCTCTPTALQVCSATTTTTAPNCTTYTSGTTSVSSTSKAFLANLDLRCELTAIPIEATAGDGTPGSANLVIGGADGYDVICTEYDKTTNAPKLNTGGQELTGMFKFQQRTPLNDCISVTDDLNGRKTWTCAVADGPQANPLLWTLTPKATDDVNLFCRIDPTIAGPADIPVNDCFAKLGVPSNVNFANGDFENRDVDGDAINDFDGVSPGAVVTFNVPDGDLKFGPCHSGSFVGAIGGNLALGDQIECAKTPVGQTEPVKTRSGGAFKAQLIVESAISPSSLNLDNRSKTAAFPVVFYGSAGFSVQNIVTNPNTAISVSVGTDGVNQPLTIKNFTYQDAPGANGLPDGILDLKVDFYRGSISTPGSFIFAVTHPNGLVGTPANADCPAAGAKTIDVTFSGTVGKTGATGAWVGSENGVEDISIFNCPTAK